jgi:hypothetical protein
MNMYDWSKTIKIESSGLTLIYPETTKPHETDWNLWNCEPKYTFPSQKKEIPWFSQVFCHNDGK